MTDYNDQERQTLRTAAFGAIFLVSSADPGFFDMVKESFAGSKAFANSSPELRDLLKSGGIPPVPKGSPASHRWPAPPEPSIVDRARDQGVVPVIGDRLTGTTP